MSHSEKDSCKTTDKPLTSSNIFAEDEAPQLSEEQQEFKRILYERMSPRRRKFIDKIGYDNWDPFQEPKQPLDMRRDRTARTLQDLLNEFMRDTKGARKDEVWQKGAAECALGIIQKNEKYQGIFDFCLWYARLLEKEGHLQNR